METINIYGVNIISLGLILAFLLPIVFGVLFKVRSRSMMETLKSVLTSIALICALFLTVIFVKEAVIKDSFGMMSYISNNISSSMVLLFTKTKLFLGFVHLIVFLIIYNIFKLIIEILNKLILYPVSKSLDEGIRKCGKGIRALLGGIFQLPRAICYLIILTALLTYANLFISNKSLSSTLGDSKIYTYINNKVITPIIQSDAAQSFPNIIEDSFKIVDAENNLVNTDENYVKGLVFYNGVTLDEGVKSNEAIDETAREITSAYSGNYEKGKAIYQWIGGNISYDDNKAVEVMQNQFPRNVSSGAISAFSSRSGVCFDYACLYVAMCRANDIPVRLIVGEGYNGVTWVSHSWNEIYISEEEGWVPVDSTFYNAGNYFDNYGFNAEHRKKQIAGEWK